MKQTILSALLVLFSVVCFAAFPVHSPAIVSEVLQRLPEGVHHQAGHGGGWGIASLITAILGFPLLPLIFGALGMQKRRKLKGLAIAGFVLGVIEAILLTLLVMG